MSMTTPFPETASRELERFALYGRQEIVGLLRELRDRQVLVTLYYDERGQVRRQQCSRRQRRARRSHLRLCG